MIHGGINDLTSPVHETVNGKKCYILWNKMLKRVSGLENRESYKTVRVCDEWYKLSNFKKWFDENYIEEYELDKDLLSHKNDVVYSPSTCVFIPKYINTFLQEKHKRKTLIGVTEVKSKTMGIRYKASIKKNGVYVFLGYHDDAETAHLKWKSEKYKHALEIIESYPELNDHVKEKLRTRYSGNEVYIPNS